MCFVTAPDNWMTALILAAAVRRDGVAKIVRTNPGCMAEQATKNPSSGGDQMHRRSVLRCPRSAGHFRTDMTIVG